MRDGLRVSLAALVGMTDKGLLESPFYFQAPPLEEFTVEYSYSHTDYDTIGDGQYSRKGGVQLRTTTFDTLLVDFATWTVTSDFPPIEEITEQLIELVESGSPFLLTVAHATPADSFVNWELSLAGPELQMPATLRSLRVSEKAGEGDARYLNVSFTEYRDPVVARTKRGKKKRGGGKTFPQTVLMTSGGSGFEAGTNKSIGPSRGGLGSPLTLDRIARHYYGDSTMAKHVAHHNGLTDWGWSVPLLSFGAGNQPIGHPRFVAARRRWARANPGLAQANLGAFLDEKITVPAPAAVLAVREGDAAAVLRY